MPLQVDDDSRQLRAGPSQTSEFAFQAAPTLNIGVNFKQHKNLGLILNQWLSEVESEHTDSSNSKLNICSSSSNMEWVTVPVTHWGFWWK